MTQFLQVFVLLGKHTKEMEYSHTYFFEYLFHKTEQKIKRDLCKRAPSEAAEAGSVEERTENIGLSNSTKPSREPVKCW